MNLRHKVLFVTLLLPIFLFSQNNDLATLMNQLAEEIKQVESKKYTYEQSLTYDEKFPYRANFEATRIDGKGKTKTKTYQFNLKDFDNNSVRLKNVKDVIVVQFNVDKRQKFIAVLTNGERDKFANELEIIATDVDNARAIIDLLKKIIPLAKQIPPTELLPVAFDARIAWLKKNIVEAEKNGKPISQKINNDEKLYPTRLVFEVEMEGKKSTKKETYKFNLIDLKGKKMRLDVKGKNIFIELSSNEKYIRYEKNGELSNFQKDFKIYVPTIEAGKNIVKIFQALIEESPKKVNQVASRAGISVRSTFDGKSTYNQKMEGGCVATFETSHEGKKGETKTSKSVFNFDDLNAKSVKIKISKKTIWVNTEAAKSKKLISNFENDELKNYSNKWSVRASSIENARVLKKELETKIKDCDGKSACKLPSQESNALMVFVKEQIKDIETGSKSYQQELELTGDQPHQWRFTRTKIKKKGSEEKAYVFNLSDIDAKRVSFEVSKKEVTIVLHTVKKEEIIKTYKDSEPDNYENSFEIYVADIATARNLVCALKTAIEKL